MKKILSILATALMVCLGLAAFSPVTSPAAASGGGAGGGAACNPLLPITECDNWWKKRNTSAADQTGLTPNSQEDYARAYTYPGYDLNCTSPDVATQAIQTVAIVPNGKSDDNTYVNSPKKFRQMTQRAASIFAASTRRKYGPNHVDKELDHSPRFTTYVNNNGKCKIHIKFEEFPASKLVAAESNWDDVEDILEELEDRGYDQINRKYLYLLQTNFVGGWAGSSDGVQYALVATGRPNCTACLNRDGISRTAVTMAHEILHAIGNGGVSSAAPHSDPNNPGHIKADGHDIMQYSWNNNRCSHYRRAARFDCGRDDYFNIGNPNWPTNQLNVAKSPYLWNDTPLRAVDFLVTP